MSLRPSVTMALASCVGALAFGVITNACGSEDSTFGDGNGGTSGGASGTSGSSFGSSGTSGGGDQTDGQATGDANCASATGETALKPLDMFVILDRTASMGTDCNIGDNTDSLWCHAINSLAGYFTSPSSKSNAAAFHFFSRNNACDGSGHDISTVPGGQTGYVDLPSTAFNAALNGENPTGGFGTRTEGALNGVKGFTSRAANRRPGRATIGVVVTDGDPTECSTDNTVLSNILAGLFTTTGGDAGGGVRTYLIGIQGADDATLEAIAAGGNAPLHPTNVAGLTNTCGSSASPCRHWNVGKGTNGVLAEALKAIQAGAVGCSVRMPKPETGTLDLNQVTVTYSPGGAPPGLVLNRVANAAACVAKSFFYDNNDNPASINLCPDVCATVSADPNAKLEVHAACVTGGTGGVGVLK